MGEHGAKICLGQNTEEDGIIHSRVREEIFIFGREYRLADNVRNVFVLDNIPAFPRQFDQHLTVRVVNVAYGGRLKPYKRIQVRQICSVEVDVEEREQRKGHGQSCKYSCNPEKATNLRIAP